MIKQPPNGEEPITPIPEPPHPGERLPGYRIQETFGVYTVAATPDDGPATCRVVFETVAGGKNLRTETGEIVVAVENAAGDAFTVLRPAGGAEPLPLTDAAVEPVLARMRGELAARDDAMRRDARASRDAYWADRHASAQAWGPAPPPPEPTPPTPDNARK